MNIQNKQVGLPAADVKAAVAISGRGAEVLREVAGLPDSRMGHFHGMRRMLATAVDEATLVLGHVDKKTTEIHYTAIAKKRRCWENYPSREEMTMNKNSTQKRVNDESFDPTVTRCISMRHSTFTRMIEKLKEEQFGSVSDCAEQLILRGLNAYCRDSLLSYDESSGE